MLLCVYKLDITVTKAGTCCLVKITLVVSRTTELNEAAVTSTTQNCSATSSPTQQRGSTELRRNAGNERVEKFVKNSSVQQVHHSYKH